MEGLSRSEIPFSQDLVQSITEILSSADDHERKTFFDQLNLLTRSSKVYSIAPVRGPSGNYDRLVILGPQEMLKRANIQAEVFLNSQR